MAFTRTDVINRAVILGNLNPSDYTLMGRVEVTVDQVLTKTEIYIGYDPKTVDLLLNIEAEIVVTEIAHYQNLQSTSISGGATKRITRGDYTVEYDTQSPVTITNQTFFNTYEHLLKKFKKLRSI